MFSTTTTAQQQFSTFGYPPSMQQPQVSPPQSQQQQGNFVHMGKYYQQQQGGGFNGGSGYPHQNNHQGYKFGNGMGYQGGHHQQHHHQYHNNHGYQQHRSRFECPPPTFSIPSGFGPSSGIMMMSTASNSPPAISISNDGSNKDETPREVFFRTLATSLKEANKYFSGRSTTWKNPFLYKTSICENYCSRSYSSYGDNCWYAHGIHELRCIPESDELPDAEFIGRYLSFLGLPQNVLDDIIKHAFHAAHLFTELRSFVSSKRSSSDPPSLDSTGSSTFSPLKDIGNVAATCSSPIPTFASIVASGETTAASTKYHGAVGGHSFASSFTTSNGGDWNAISTAINGAMDENSSSLTAKPSTPSAPTFATGSSFGKSFRLFGESYPILTAPGN